VARKAHIRYVPEKSLLSPGNHGSRGGVRANIVTRDLRRGYINASPFNLHLTTFILNHHHIFGWKPSRNLSQLVTNCPNLSNPSEWRALLHLETGSLYYSRPTNYRDAVVTCFRHSLNLIAAAMSRLLNWHHQDRTTSKVVGRINTSAAFG